MARLLGLRMMLTLVAAISIAAASLYVLKAFKTVLEPGMSEEGRTVTENIYSLFRSAVTQYVLSLAAGLAIIALFLYIFIISKPSS